MNTLKKRREKLRLAVILYTSCSRSFIVRNCPWHVSSVTVACVFGLFGYTHNKNNKMKNEKKNRANVD